MKSSLHNFITSLFFPIAIAERFIKANILIPGLIIILTGIGSTQTVIENRWSLGDTGPDYDWLEDVAIDDSGYIYFCATLEGATSTAVGRLTPDLLIDWFVPTIYTSTSSGNCIGLALGDSSLFVAANSGSSSNTNALLYRYDKYTGKRSYTYYDNLRHTGDWITDICLDKQDNVIIAGTSYYRSDSSEGFVFKYSKDLNLLWGKTFLDPISLWLENNHLAVDDSGNVYVAGKRTMKFSPSGDLRWTQFSADWIVADKQGRAITALQDGPEWIIEKYDANGNRLWDLTYDDGTSMGPITVKMVIDDLDNIYLCGNNEYPWYGWHTVKFKPDGSKLWSADIRSPIGDRSFPYDLVVDRKGNVYVTGAYVDVSGDNFFSAVTIRYDALGKEIWRQTDGIGNSNDEYGSCIAVNDSLIVAVGGFRSLYEDRYSGELLVWQYKQKERFKAIPDGWKYLNWEVPMWQPDHWVQFDYSKPPYPPGWVAWYLAMPFDWPDWPVFVRAFGENQCYINPVPGNRVYNPIAVKYWRSLVQGAKYTDPQGTLHHWRGSCYGFCLSSLLFYNDKLKLGQHFPGYERTYDVPLIDESLNMIHSYQLYQFGALQNLTRKGRYSLPLNVTVPEIEEMLIQKRKNNKSLAIFNNNGTGGHEVVPCSLATVTPGLLDLYIYDCNYPGIEQVINLNTSVGTWFYNKMPGWGGSAGLFLDEDIELTSIQPILPLSTSFIDYLIVFTTPNATTMIEDHQGNQMGYLSENGQVINNIDNAEPIIPMTGAESPPIGYILPDNKYKINTEGSQDSIYTVTLFSDSTMFSVKRIDCSDTQNDLLSIDSSLRRIRYINPDAADKKIEIEAISNLPGQVMTCRVGNINFKTNDSLDVSFIKNNDYRISNYGTDRTYDLRLEYAFEPGYRVFEHSGLLIEHSYAHYISPDWEYMENKKLLIFVDRDGDGIADDTLEVDNEFVSGIQDETNGLVPNEFVVDQNYPNPFNPLTTIRFGIPEQAHLKIIIYNILGQEVAVLADEIYEAGYSRVFWDAGNYSSGIYFCRLQAVSTRNPGVKYNRTIKMLLVK